LVWLIHNIHVDTYTVGRLFLREQPGTSREAKPLEAMTLNPKSSHHQKDATKIEVTAINNMHETGLLFCNNGTFDLIIINNKNIFMQNNHFSYKNCYQHESCVN